MTLKKGFEPHTARLKLHKTGSNAGSRCVFQQPVKAHYLDSAIMCYPNAIGAPDSMILVGGKEGPLKGAEPFLEVLGGDLRYLGENIASAATLDLALLSTSVALYLGVAHSAHICESEGVGVDLLASVASRKVKDCDLRDEAPTIPETAI